MSEPVEKSPMTSKKFIAFILTELGFFVLMGLMLLQGVDKLGDNLAFMVLAVTAGFIATGYILGQSYIDKYVRVATLLSGKEK